MKTIKIIMASIIFMVLVFLATGFVVKEVIYTNEVLVNKSVSEVFSTIEDVELIKQWLPDIKSIQSIDLKTNKQGSLFKLIIDNQGSEEEITLKILVYEVNTKIVYQYTSEAMIKKEEFQLTKVENQTKVVQKTSVFSTSFLTACVFPWFKGRFEKLTQQTLEKFKKVTENRN